MVRQKRNRTMLYQSSKLDMTVAVLAHEKPLKDIKRTFDSLVNLQHDYKRILCVSEQNELNHPVFDNTILCKSGNSITTSIDAACKIAKTEWLFFVFAGSYLPKNIDNKNSRYAQDYKDVIFPVANRQWNFVEATMNGLLISKQFHEEVGDFGTGNQLDITKLIWADRAMQKGVKFKAIVGAKLI